EHLVVGGSGGGGGGGSSGATRIPGRRSASSAMVGTPSSSQQSQDGNGKGSGWGPSSSTPPGPSLQQGSGGGVGGGDVNGGMGFMGNSSGDENLTTEDPYVRFSFQRAIVELFDTYHRILSFKKSKERYLADSQRRRLSAADGIAPPSCRGSGDSRRSSQTETETAL
ncbi:unnamed protein product, partial [Ectocarpus fasciculatus]